MFDLIIIGAGPAGLSAAYEAKKAGLDHLVLEKGLIANTVYQYPIGLTVFSTPHELEFESASIESAREKPTREELLSYYVHFALENELNIQTEEGVIEVARNKKTFTVKTDKGSYKTKTVLFAIGAMDHPRHLNVPGEDLPKVHHLFRETYPYVKKHALVLGGGNSAGEAALFLAREGADSTLAIFREDWENTDPKQGCIKYWVKQPLEEQVEKDCLKVFFLKRVVEIKENEIVLEDDDGDLVTLPNDVVFVLIGSDAELTLLTHVGVGTRDSKYGTIPVYDEETFETNVPGIFVAGHFTQARHIKEAIAIPRKIIPHVVGRLRR